MMTWTDTETVAHLARRAGLATLAAHELAVEALLRSHAGEWSRVTFHTQDRYGLRVMMPRHEVARDEQGRRTWRFTDRETGGEWMVALADVGGCEPIETGEMR